MKINYCLPILHKNPQDVRECVRKYSHQYSHFEIWLDYLCDAAVGLVKELADQQDANFIFLLRRQRLEPAKLNSAQQIQIIESISEMRAVLDLDFTTQLPLVECIRERQLSIPLLLSYHNYSYTPASGELGAIIAQMQRFAPDIVKVATLCNTEHDVVRLLALMLELRESGQRCIVLGMGKHGAATRIFGTLWGNEMIYAPIESSQASAPGQLTLNSLERIFSELGTVYRSDK